MIHDAELFAVAHDEAVITFRTEVDQPATTIVGDHAIETSGLIHHVRVVGLDPATEYTLRVEGAEPTRVFPSSFTTLARPTGRRLATVATANDVHFGEVECGRLGDGEQLGPIFTTDPGATPYPEVMNASAIADMREIEPDAVIVKGDLTGTGSPDEYEMFLDAYGAFGGTMHHVRGNHDAMITNAIASDRAPFAVELDGVTLAVIDTVLPGRAPGAVSRQQLDWLRDLTRSTTQSVLLFGHHHPWGPDDGARREDYYGINPDDSEALCELIGASEAIAGYFAGHTHRNRVRRLAVARHVPIVEVACVKDYPGAWAEYRVYEGGYSQIVRRASSAAALAWSEKTRQMFAGVYREYALGAMTDRCFTQPF